jgi:hypothetical protein
MNLSTECVAEANVSTEAGDAYAASSPPSMSSLTDADQLEASTTGFLDDLSASTTNMKVHIVFVIYSLALNTILLRGIWKTSSIPKLTKTLLTNLSICELYFVPTTFIRLFLANSDLSCAFLVLGGVVSDGVAHLTICLFAVTHFNAIKNVSVPNQSTIKFRYVVITIAGFWLAFLVIAYIPLGFLRSPLGQGCYIFNGVIPEEYLAFLNIYYVVVTTFLTLIQLTTLYLMRVHHQKLVASGGEDSLWVQSWYKQQMKITFTIGLLWLAFVICSGPFYVTAAIYFLCPNHCGLDRSDTMIPATFLIAKSSVFSLIYLARINEFRQTITRSFFCCRCQPRAVQPAPVLAVGSNQAGCSKPLKPVLGPGTTNTAELTIPSTTSKTMVTALTSQV